MSEQNGTKEGSGVNKNNSVNRRHFVKSLGIAGGTAAIGVGTGRVSAKSTNYSQGDLLETKQSYDTPDKVYSAVEQYGQDVLAELSQAGIYDSTTVSTLPIRSLLSVEEYSNAAEGTNVSVVEEGSILTAHISVKMVVENHKIELFVQPHAGQGYAIVEPKTESEKMFVVDPHNEEIASASSDDFTTQDFCRRDGCYCGPECCHTRPCNLHRKFPKICCASCSCCHKGSPLNKCCSPILQC